MTAALAPIPYGDDSSIVEADEASELRVGGGLPHARYVKTVDASGVIRLIPLASLHESERAILESSQLYRDTRKGVVDALEGRRSSLDWMFDEEE
ncbi:hypothetical protein [Rhodococcus sp. SORGH_AS_0303]|uniref:hypothetical protein n=1 Tax=Rhodococcus sp. SORGH_AS_0303 TaxID=3041753 RepID=UPI00277D52F6|nr:hypothetical protein [Rhodococcus sp. SORGH_AS_0303]MDQ1201094.1 hypothetical protein [Rhodococcus sp. SORGH_AS_0303]